MQKTDIRELRKELKKAPTQDGIIDWVYGFYVTSENEIAWEDVRKYYNFEEEEKFRHSDIVNKTASIGIGKDMFPVSVKQNDEFLAFRNAWEDDEEKMKNTLKNFQEKVLSEYLHTDPYYASVSHILYDVPGKASDGARLEDENTLYDALLFSICPAKLSTPALGFEEGRVTDLTRRWTIGAPKCGFVYPSFSDRGADCNEAGFFMKKSHGEDLLKILFETEEETIDADQQNDLWKATLSDMGVSAETASLINESICEYSEENSSAFLGKETLRRIVEESGGDGEAFENSYENIIGDFELSAEAISKTKVEVQTGSAKVVVPSEAAAFLKTKKIDGIEYILVPVDGVITVNGAEVIG